MKCKVCGNENSSCSIGKILDKFEIQYFHCSNCGFVHTEEPYWLDEAYSKSINFSDTGYVSRNIFYANRLASLFYLIFGKNGHYLDFAGGYGLFVRLMRDIGLSFSWQDKYAENIFAQGFEWDGVSPVNAITLIEAIEHFVDPIEELGKLINFSKTIVFTTEIYPDPLPKPNDWWYFGLEHGQHISFFSERTLRRISLIFSLHYYRFGNLHVFTDIDIPWLKIQLQKLNKFGFYLFIKSRFISKTWEDHLKMLDY